MGRGQNQNTQSGKQMSTRQSGNYVASSGERHRRMRRALGMEEYPTAEENRENRLPGRLPR